MKRKYEAPEIEIQQFLVEDIIAVSGPTTRRMVADQFYEDADSLLGQ
jgi:hypothetical protein